MSDKFQRQQPTWRWTRWYRKA